MSELEALRSLAEAMGVHTRYEDGLGRPVTVAPETLVRVVAALGAPVAGPEDAPAALRAREAEAAAGARRLAPVLLAWDGVLPPIEGARGKGVRGEIMLEDGGEVPLRLSEGGLEAEERLPLGYHRLRIGGEGERLAANVISAPRLAWRREGLERGWGLGAQLAALRSERSRSLGDLRDLEALAAWMSGHGGEAIMLLPLLPTFNDPHPEPSPYAAVSRLFWSELLLDLGEAHRPLDETPTTLDVGRADVEVRAALAGASPPDPVLVDEELARYARFRGAQARWGRNWRDGPAPARAGRLEPEAIDAEEERFHLVAQTRARRQLRAVRERLDEAGVRLGLDLAVGVHPDGYDVWSRQELFVEGMSVGAPPDLGFPSGQDWGFAPLLPEASRREGHAYVAASIAAQAGLAGVLRVDHIMALSRLYWIPHGFGKDEGTYVSYPAEELFAVLTLESVRHRCEMVGENLGTVPPEIDDALPRHRIRGMYLAQFRAAEDPDVEPPTEREMALVGTHDTPTFAGWIAGEDIDERLEHGLLAAEEEERVREERARAVRRLADRLGRSPDDPARLFEELLDWLGGSESPLVLAWLEDLWLEERGVNLPGTRSSERPNWQRPMRLTLDEAFADPDVDRRLVSLARARVLASRDA